MTKTCNVVESSRCIKVTIAASLALVLSACGSAPQVPPQPRDILAEISAAADVNPDVAGRPSPLVLRIILLADPAPFIHASFEALSPDSEAALGASRLDEIRVTVRPGERLNLPLTVQHNARAIGVIAEFADLLSAQWRAWHEESEGWAAALGGRRLVVTAGRDVVQIAIESTD